MKHDLKPTIFLMLLFFAAQFVGLFLLNISIENIALQDDGSIDVVYTEPITGRPELEGSSSLSYILVMVLFGTALLLGIIKLKLFKIWKAWFFLAIFGALSISISAIIPESYSLVYPNDIAMIIAAIFTYFKLYRPNVLIHNSTEVFMYAGITIMISPIFNVFWASVLLIAISIYDAIAVWKLKHMITLATAQAENKMFAGLLIPYSKKKNKNNADEKDKEVKISKTKKRETKENKVKTKEIKAPIPTKIHKDIPKGFKKEGVKSAILGGGDIAFPLIFSGSIMTSLIQQGFSKEIAFLQAFIVSVFAGVALFLLMTKGKKDRFYPAMPFISTGCFVGYGIVFVISNFLLV